MKKTDQQIIQELAKQYMEAANSEKQQRSNQRMKDSNDLKIVRPPVLIDEIPWHELNSYPELICSCEEPAARKTEWYFRRTLFQKKYLKTDMLMPTYWKVYMKYEMTPLGVEVKETRKGRTRTFEDVLKDEIALLKIKDPVFKPRPDLDEQNIEYFSDLLGDVMPVRLVGANCLYSQFWDDISQLRGVEPIYEDMYERPEYLHQTMQKFIARAKAKMDFFETQFHVDNDPYSLHCTPGMISGLEKDGLKATWYRGMAQPFSCVSPEMFKEFELDYIKPLAERCAYTYYGCCEPLDDRIELLKTIRNLRKVGVSPWSNAEKCAEQLGKNFVFARKPNPANVAIQTSPEQIRKETETSVKACLKNGCPAEFVLKDITTISHKLENLTVWVNTVNQVLDEYYDKA